MTDATTPTGWGWGRRGAAAALAATAMVVAGPAVAGAGAAAQPTARWTIQSAVNLGASSNYLTSVACPSMTKCFAGGGTVSSSGGNGIGMIETWNGTSWSASHIPGPTGATNAGLIALSCPTPTSCVGVGQYSTDTLTGVAYAESWNGTRWTATAVPSPSDTTLSYLVGVSCASATSCVAVGSWESAATDQLALLIDTFNGKTWSLSKPVLPPNATSGNLEGVDCASPTSCEAVGDYASAKFLSAPLAESWNGTRWTVQATKVPKSSNAGSTFYAVSCHTASSCMAVGNASSSPTAGAGIAERWNGTAWSLVATPPTGRTYTTLGSISCAAVTSCIAVGYAENTSSSAIPLAEGWDGTKWSIQSVPSPKGASYPSLYGVSCWAPTTCTAVGSYGLPTTGKVLVERYS